MPAMLLSEHLHENVVEEADCDYCSFSGQAAAEHLFSVELPVLDAVIPLSKPRRIAFEQFQLNQNPRGPPALC